MKTILTSITVGSLLVAAAAAQPQPRYRVIDLGGPYSFGFGINNAGDVAGAAPTKAQTDGAAILPGLPNVQQRRCGARLAR
jgi:hypothetical protein